MNFKSNRLLQRWLSLPIILVVYGSAVCAEPLSCQTFEPITALSGIAFYADAKGSKPDPKREAANQKIQAPVYAFMGYVEKAVDAPGDPQAMSCALSEFDRWAKAGALTGKPGDTEARVSRVFMVTGLNLIALKFEMRGAHLSPQTLTWLTTLTHEIAEDYKDFRGNVYEWTGGAAAVLALMTRDTQAMQYQNDVWHNSLALIQPDGFLPAELARGSRALIYHGTALSGLLILKDARARLGEAENTADISRLKRLADATGAALCNPAQLAKLAGAKQEMPGDWGFRVPYGFSDNFLSQDWFRCGVTPHSYSAVNTGGDTRVSDKAISMALYP
jgi:poly(beta-D-mannuronate) lyase